MRVVVSVTLVLTLLVGVTARRRVPSVEWPLDGDDWSLASENGSIVCPATVPGDIYTHLHKCGIIESPRLDDADQRLRWVARTRWAYERSFEHVNKSVLKVTRPEGSGSDGFLPDKF